MKTIVDIIVLAGGWRSELDLRIENPPYIPLYIKALGESGPMGLPAVSVAHYAEKSGNLVRHPEMRFELKDSVESGLTLRPYHWRNDFVAVEQSSRFLRQGRYIFLPEVYQRHIRVAAEWNEVLSRQCFTQVFAAQISRV